MKCERSRERGDGEEGEEKEEQRWSWESTRSGRQSSERSWKQTEAELRIRLLRTDRNSEDGQMTDEWMFHEWKLSTDLKPSTETETEWEL